MTCPCRGMNSRCPICNGSPEVVCSKCLGTRFVAQEVNEHVYKAIPCLACRERQIFKPRLSGLTDAMYSWTFGALFMQYPTLIRAAETLQAVLENGAGWVIIFGPNGTGKSYLLAAALNALKDYYIQSGRYWRLPDLMNDLWTAQRGEHPRQLTHNALKTEAISAGVLCLDDLEQATPNEYRKQDLRDILISRGTMRNWAITFMATSLRGAELIARYPWMGGFMDDLANVRRVDLSVMPNLRAQNTITAKGRVL